LDLKSEIRNRMAQQAPFGVWTPTDFLDLGSRDAVDQALSRMTAAEDIRRITRGLYDLPRLNALTGKPTNPDTRRVIDVLARRDQARMLVGWLDSRQRSRSLRRRPCQDRRAHRCSPEPDQAGRANHHLQTDCPQPVVMGGPTGHARRPGVALAARHAQ
jgi:hypothetical protein